MLDESDIGSIEVTTTEIVKEAPPPAVAPLQAGLALNVSIHPSVMARKDLKVGPIWEDLGEEIAALLEKRLKLKENLSVKTTTGSAFGGRVVLTLAMNPDA